MNKERYTRQILLPQIGEQGQERLARARVLVVGAGGLGCPALMYLASAGIGRIGIVDGDRIAVDNLHRQLLYTHQDLGKRKAERAAEVLQQLNPEISVEAFPVFLTQENAFDILEGYDVVVDGTDNYPTRYLLNDVCVIENKPLIYGAIYRFEGQVGVFNYRGSPNYRDLYPEPPVQVEDCSTAGVIGILPGIVGVYQAAETIKIALGIGQPLAGKVLYIDLLKGAQHTFHYTKNPGLSTGIPKNRQGVLSREYGMSCSGAHGPSAVDEDRLHSLLHRRDIAFIDVREPSELPKWEDSRVQAVPLSSLEENMPLLPKDRPCVFFCQMGFRSRKAVELLHRLQPDRTYSYLPFSIHKIMDYAAQMD